jgi:hypothetical protein
MKTFSILPRFRRLIPGVAAALAAGLILGARLVAADAPADSAGTWYVFTPPKDGEVVAAGKRAKLLAIAKTFVDRDNPDLLAKLTTATNPFYLDLPSPPAAAVVGNQGNNQNTPSAPPPPTKLTDSDKLLQIAAAVKPTGMIEVGSIRLITFAARDPVQVGQSFPVQFPNESSQSEVEVVDCTDNSCVFKLGNATLSADFISNASPTPPDRSSGAPPSETK